MSRKTIAGAFLALLLLGVLVAAYILYSHSLAYQAGIARGPGDPAIRKAAMADLLNRRDPDGVIPVFIELLGDKEAVIRAEAAEDLGYLRARDAVMPLIAALPKQAPPERAIFVTALGAIGDPRAMAPLAALFDTASESEAGAIAQALAKLGPEAVPMFLKRLSDAKPAIRQAAVAGLGWLALEAGDAGKEALTPAIAPMIPLLYDRVAAVRSSAADAMGNIRDPKFLTSLMLALGDPDDGVREVIGRVISYYGDAAMALLPTAFQSTDERIRLGAAEAVGATAEIANYDQSRAGASYVKAARALLDAALESHDLVAGAGAFGYYIAQGRAEAVPFLIAALEAHGHRRMANGLLNCGLPALHDAAAKWAADHGYTVEAGSGPGEYKWGKR